MSFPYKGIGHRPNAAIRSSIKSRSTSQSLSDDRRSLSVSSAWANSSSSIVSGHNIPERLLAFCGLHLDFDVRELVRLSRAAPIGDFPRESFPVVRITTWERSSQNRSAARACIPQGGPNFLWHAGDLRRGQLAHSRAEGAIFCTSTAKHCSDLMLSLLQPMRSSPLSRA